MLLPVPSWRNSRLLPRGVTYTKQKARSFAPSLLLLLVATWLEWLKVALGCATEGALPIWWQLLKGGVGRDAVLGVANRRVVDILALLATPLAHRFLFHRIVVGFLVGKVKRPQQTQLSGQNHRQNKNEEAGSGYAALAHPFLLAGSCGITSLHCACPSLSARRRGPCKLTKQRSAAQPTFVI